MDTDRVAAWAEFFVFGHVLLGALLVVAIIVTGTMKWRISALLGLIAGILADIHSGHNDWLLFARDAAAGAALGLAGQAVLSGAVALLMRTRFREEIETYRVLLNPHRWLAYSQPVAGEPPPVPLTRQTPLTDQEITRRWYVTLAAALGSIVFSLGSDGSFWSSLRDSLTPERVMGATIVVAFAVVLVGPIQDYVFDRSLSRKREGDGAGFAEAMLHSVSRRSALRLLLIFAFALVLLELVSDSLNQSVTAKSSHAPLTILLAAVTPGIVSYYWCAILQLGIPRNELRQVAGGTATACCAIFSYFSSVALCIALGLLSTDPKAALLVVASPFAGLFAAALVGFMTAGVHAWLGAWVLERMSNWQAMAGLGAALVLGSIVHSSFSSFLLFALTGQFDWTTYIYSAVGALGWLTGLIASGFPRIVTNYPASAEAGAPAATEAAGDR
ncbi:MAG: hypothetical protein AB7G34_05480 [Hyphomicrobiales bacterium]